MKHKLGKMLSFMLAIAMLVTLLPTMALAGGEVTETVDGMTFSYTDDAELVRLSSTYDACPIVIWKGHIKVTFEDETSTLLNSASSELLGKLRPVWRDSEG